MHCGAKCIAIQMHIEMSLSITLRCSTHLGKRLPAKKFESDEKKFQVQLCNSIECRYAECRVLIVMVSVIMFSVALFVVILSVVMLIVVGNAALGFAILDCYLRENASLLTVYNICGF